MSASSVRRLKDRDGGAGVSTATARAAALKPSKTLTPISTSSKVARLSTGKENPRSTSRGSATSRIQKPSIRVVPAVDKTSLVGSRNGGETRVRGSTSSAPRGRSSSPSDFIRVFPDMGKGRRASVDRVDRRPIADSGRVVSSAGKVVKGSKGLDVSNQKKGIRDLNHGVSEEGANGIKRVDFSQENVSIGVNAGMKFGNLRELKKKSSDNSTGLNSSFRMVEDYNKKIKLNSNPLKSSSAFRVSGEKESSISEVRVAGKHNEERCSVSDMDVGNEKVGDAIVSCSERVMASVGAIEIVKEIKSDCGIANKYPSKLHEKLAFLEGKVKRIASDIKKTKELLDMNNPDESKMMLTDIQDKISGIEKAIGPVRSDPDPKMGSSNSNGNEGKGLNMIEKMGNKEGDKGKCSVKVFNKEELEDRLFPHHKLLRNRTSVKAPSEKSNDAYLKEPGLQSKVEEKMPSSVDELIELEFLTSLNKDQSKVIGGDGQESTEFFEVKGTDAGVSAGVKNTSSSNFGRKCDIDLLLASDEKLDEFDDQENKEEAVVGEEAEDACIYQSCEIGSKTSTGGWFISEGEAVLLAHDDGSCSYYDIANQEEKAVYKPAFGLTTNIWRDCWIIRAPGPDGCSGRFVVAASAGNTLDSGFCSWDFYTREIRAFRAFQDEGVTNGSRTILGPLSDNILHGRNSISNTMAPDVRQWWYKPCGPLVISTASSQRLVKVFDVRDGEPVMKWEVQKPVMTMDYSSPLQWRNRAKVVIAETETISLWDVNSLDPQALLTISSSSGDVCALHVCNTDAELGAGVRQRVSSSDAEGHDGVFCTSDYINILDFRVPTGVGLKILKLGVSVQSVFSRGDSVFLGCTSLKMEGKKHPLSMVQQFSLRKQGLFSTYALPESNAHPHHTEITQVWGNSELVMGVNGLGLFVFDALRDDGLQAFKSDVSNTLSVKQVIGPDDLYSPSFDYLGSRALLISRDRPALWRYI